MGYSYDWKRRKSTSLINCGLVIRCTSENHVPIVAISQELRTPTSPRRLRPTDCESQVPEHQETSRMTFQHGFSFSTKASGEPPDSHNVVVEQPVVEPKKKTPDKMGESRRRGNRSSCFRRPNTSKPTVRHKLCAHFLEDPNCELCQLTKTTSSL